VGAVRSVVRGFGLAAALLLSASASAAEPQPAATSADPPTRAEAWRRMRAEKSTRLHAYVPKGVEKFAVNFEDNVLPRLTTPRGGFFPFIGRITTGGGFAVGPGYRVLDVAGGAWTSSAAVSIKQYWQIDSRLTWVNLANGRAFASTYGRYFRYPREDFYGLGPDSDRADRTDFDHRQGAVGATVGTRPTRWLTVAGTAEYLRPKLGPGADNSVPNPPEVLPPDQLPGFRETHDFVRVEGFADVQTARPLLNPRKGGRYRAAIARYSDRSGNHDGFTRYDVDLQQYVSVLNERRVFVVRALGSFSDVASDSQMPFYLMRTLGGSHTLRGFRDFRFRDRHLLAVQAEYRFEILTALDGALFYDAGQVVPRLDNFQWREFERDWGFGLRFGSNGGVFLRLDLAYGGEGPRTWLRFGHVF
jgi:hypothetical protein